MLEPLQFLAALNEVTIATLGTGRDPSDMLALTAVHLHPPHPHPTTAPHVIKDANAFPRPPSPLLPQANAGSFNPIWRRATKDAAAASPLSQTKHIWDSDSFLFVNSKRLPGG